MSTPSGREFGTRVTASLLDRLVDHDPHQSQDTAETGHESVEAFRDAVQRDLENLLNTKNPYHDLPPEFVEAGQSVLTYGLRDLSQFDGRHEADRTRICHLLEQAIRTFEPRLTAVTVTALPSGAATDRRSGRLPFTARFRIDARLLIEPASEPVSFEFDQAETGQEWKVRALG